MPTTHDLPTIDRTVELRAREGPGWGLAWAPGHRCSVRAPTVAQAIWAVCDRLALRWALPAFSVHAAAHGRHEARFRKQ